MSTSFTLKNINISNLDKTHIIPDMAETSFKTSPRMKKTKVKDLMDEKKAENTLDDDKADKIIIKNGINTTVFYTTIGGVKITQGETIKQTYSCFHCHCDINPGDFFLGIPIKKNNGYFECVGITCSFECAATHIKLRNIVKDSKFTLSFQFLANMYFLLYKKMIPKNIANRPLFAFEACKKYGGDIDKYGKKILCETGIHISPEATGNKILFCIQPTLYQELKK